MFSNIVSTFFSRILTILVMLFVMIFNSNQFGAEGVGSISLIILNVTIIQLIATFIGGTTLVYLIPRRDPKLLLKLSFYWALLANLLGVTILHLAGMIPEGYTVLLFFMALSVTFFTINLSVLQAYEKIKALNVFQVMQSLILIAMMGVLLFFYRYRHYSLSIDIYIYAYFFSYLVLFLISFRLVLRLLRKPTQITVNQPIDTENQPSLTFWEQLKEMAQLGFWVQIANLTQLFNYRLSYYLIEFYVGRKPLGVYDMGTKISEAIWVLPKSLSLVQYARLSNTDDNQYAQKITSILAKISTLFTFVALCILLILPSSLFVAIFGPDFGEVKKVIFVLAPGILSISFLTIISHYFAAQGLYRINAISSLIGLCITVLGGFIFIPLMAHYGTLHAILTAGVVTSVSYLSSLIFSLIIFYQRNRALRSVFMIKREDFTIFATEIKQILILKRKR